MKAHDYEHPGQVVSGIEDEPFSYPAPHYCANGECCAAMINNHPQRLNALHSVDGEICHACKARELRRKLNRITVAGDLFERKMRREGLSL
jgi:hypothetical protein